MRGFETVAAQPPQPPLSDGPDHLDVEVGATEADHVAVASSSYML